MLGCGIFGIFKHTGNAAAEIYEGLLMLQHRGQDSAGIVAFDGDRFRERKVCAVLCAPGRPRCLPDAQLPSCVVRCHRTTAW